MEFGRLLRHIFINLFKLGITCSALVIFILAFELVVPGFYPINDPIVIQLLQILIWLGMFGTILGGQEVIKIIRSKNHAFNALKEITENITAPISEGSRSQFSYLLADSIDREVLQVVKDVGGNLLDIEERLANIALVPRGESCHRSLAKLNLLGLAILSEKEKKLYLTSLGMDALNTPSTLFATRIPEEIWNYVFQVKVSLWQQEWSAVVVETGKALEAILKERLADASFKTELDWDKIKAELSPKDVSKWGAGHLLGALRKLGFVRVNSFEDYLASELVKLRNLVHDKKEGHVFTPGEADRCDIYLGLLLRAWYGPR